MTWFGYDQLHRLTGKGYSDSTPSVTFIYDWAEWAFFHTNIIGRLTHAVTSDSGWYEYGYDAMGRQVLLHMLPRDRDLFLEFVQQRDPVIITQMTAPSPEVQSIKRLSKHSQFSCLWNRNLLPALKRKFIPESDEGPYYRIDQLTLPVLEFTSSFRVTWNGRPALGQGRLYGIFEGKPPEFKEWYEALVRWIRKNFRRSPAFGGCVGPAAYKFYRNGGILLPYFRPPKTSEWLAEIGKQHRR